MFTVARRVFKFNKMTPALKISSPKFNFCHHHNQCGGFSKTLVRKPAPSFSGNSYWNGEFKKISLDQFKGKWVVLFFYPLDFTFVCPTEIVDFNTSAEEFNKLSKLNFNLL